MGKNKNSSSSQQKQEPKPSNNNNNNNNTATATATATSSKEAREAAEALAAASASLGTNAEFITSSPSQFSSTKPPPTTSQLAAATAAAAKKEESAAIKVPKPSKLQNAVYIFLVFLSIGSLLWLVFVSMQPISFAPCTLLNGTWFVSEDDAAMNPLLVGKFSASGLSSDNILNLIPAISGINIDSLVGPREPSEYEIAEMEKIAKNIVQVDLKEFVEHYGAANDSLRIPEEALPINLAPLHVDPLFIRQLSVTYNGGAKVHWWTGQCKSRKGIVSTKTSSSSSFSSSSSVVSKCSLMILRGHWALSIFPLVGEELTKAVEVAASSKGRKIIPSPISALEPFTVIGTRLDSNEVAEEVVFNRKVKYVLALMAFVGIIHYGLSVVQPPNPKKIRRDAALSRLLEIERHKLAQAQAEAAKGN